jgi:hypothetical protein
VLTLRPWGPVFLALAPCGMTAGVETRAHARPGIAAVGAGKRTQPSMPGRDRKPRDGSTIEGSKESENARRKQPRRRPCRSATDAGASTCQAIGGSRVAICSGTSEVRTFVSADAACRRSASISARAGPEPKNASSHWLSAAARKARCVSTRERMDGNKRREKRPHGSSLRKRSTDPSAASAAAQPRDSGSTTASADAARYYQTTAAATTRRRRSRPGVRSRSSRRRGAAELRPALLQPDQ